MPQWRWAFRPVGADPTVQEFYAGDARRQRSPEVEYGSGWGHDTDPAATYALRWIAETHELCALRYPHPPPVAPTVVWPDFSPPVAPSEGAYTVKVIGRVLTREILDEALTGWETQVNRPNSLQWIHDRLTEASSRSPYAQLSGGDSPAT